MEHQEHGAKRISIHPAYNEGGTSVNNLYFDYALVHTKYDFEYQNHILPVCLPSPLEKWHPYTEDECYVMGYGKDKYGKYGF